MSGVSQELELNKMGIDPTNLCFGPHKAECKYCWHKAVYGKSTHFYCSAFQYCCGDRCCENINEFYKLWYFWLCIFILVLSLLIAIYWLKSHYNKHTNETSRTHRHRRRGRRYRQLTGDSNMSAPSVPEVLVPPTVITTPPPYQGDNSVCPHPGPPPYTLGSGSSINSQTLPCSPPPYSSVEKKPPPSYDYVIQVTDLADLPADKKDEPES